MQLVLLADSEERQSAASTPTKASASQTVSDFCHDVKENFRSLVTAGSDRGKKEEEQHQQQKKTQNKTKPKSSKQI